jgi:putative DNA methylase
VAIVAEGQRKRVYLPANAEHATAAEVPKPQNIPTTEIPNNPRYLTAPNYGLTHHSDLFTNRQLTALTTFSDLVMEARAQVLVRISLNPTTLNGVKAITCFGRIRSS